MGLPVDAVVLLIVILTSPLAALLIVGGGGLWKILQWQNRVPPDLRHWAARRWVFWPAAGYLALYVGCFLYGVAVEASWVEVTRTEIPVPTRVLGRERFRIVHLSDLHLDGLGTREARVLRRVREAEPDLIVLTGDYMNAASAEDDLVDFLRALKAPHGVYGVAGNWDVKYRMDRIFAKAGAVLLEDETRVLERDGAKLRIAGGGIYPVTRLRDLLPASEDAIPTVYLHHKPDAVDELDGLGADQRVDLFLCGHTHGGQVCLPFWGAVVTLSKYHKRYERGLYEVGSIPMYVNRGVGMEGGAIPRVRFLARPEVAVIDLVARN